MLVLCNLYGEIPTDEPAELQGWMGTAGGSEIGKRYAMFEAVRGLAPRIGVGGQGQDADLAGMVHAACMLLIPIGYPDK